MSNQDDKFAKLSRKPSGSMIPPDTVGVVVCPNGTGDFTSLEEALLRTPPGATLRLKAGVHALTAPVSLKQPISLIGDGRDSTIIIGTGIGFVLQIDSDGHFLIREVTCIREGSNVGDVVKVAKGEVAFERCKFTGGRNLSKDDDDGSGVLVDGTARVRIEDCEATDNSQTGFAGIENSVVTVTHSRAFQNGFCGIGGFQDGRVSIGECESNDNGFAGIAFGDRASGTIEKCTCLRNVQYGVLVGGTSTASVSLSTCSDNPSGIGLVESTAATVVKNTCTNNKACGIDVHDQAHPNVYDNLCEKNILGMQFAHNSFGTARRNCCNSNQAGGIVVCDEAHPNIDDNCCSDNQGCGIEFQDRATGIAKNNRFVNNRSVGIGVAATASPILEANEGEVFRQNSGGASSQGTSSDCFVVTATFGSPYSAEVGTYRAFRDQVLCKYWVGRALIRIYDRIGPIAAGYVRPRRRLRTILSAILGRGAQLIH